MTGSVDADEVPTSVEAIYRTLLDHENQVIRYDLVHAAPVSIQLTDGSYLVVKLDTEQYPPPLERTEEAETGGW